MAFQFSLAFLRKHMHFALMHLSNVSRFINLIGLESISMLINNHFYVAMVACHKVPSVFGTLDL